MQGNIISWADETIWQFREVDVSVTSDLSQFCSKNPIKNLVFETERIPYDDGGIGIKPFCDLLGKSCTSNILVMITA